MKGEATTTDFSNSPRTVLTFNITDNIRKKLGHDGKRIESIKVVRFSDRLNTRGVYVCTDDDDVLEEIAPTPLQACGLVTIMNGKFVLIESGGETSLHFSNAPSRGRDHRPGAHALGGERTGRRHQALQEDDEADRAFQQPDAGHCHVKRRHGLSLSSAKMLLRVAATARQLRSLTGGMTVA